MGGRVTRGMWSVQERNAQINLLELIEGTFAVKTFARDSVDAHIKLRMDNRAAVTYINRLGGTRSPTLTLHVKELWDWCLQRGITLSAEYLPGSLNVTADRESRMVQSMGEWMLDPAMFRAVDSNFGPLTVDIV